MTVIAHQRLRTPTHRRLTGLLAAVITAAALLVVAAPAAQAQSYTCPEYTARTIELDDGAVSATINVVKDCSDGRSRFDGVVRDIKCDGRSAYLWLDFANPDAWINQWGGATPYRSENPSATNGCGTQATFSYSSTNPRPIMRAEVYADSWGSAESDGDEAWF